MNGGFIIVIIAAGIALMVLLAVLSWLSAKRRREAFQAYAAQKGWSLTERDDSWVERFSGPPFETGHNKQARNILQGSYDGRPFVAMDYVFHTTETRTDGEGRTSTHEVSHTYGVCALDTGVAFPGLSVTPEGFFGRMVGRLSGRDIELESEDFNRAFTVHCEDRKFASDVLHPRLMETLLRTPEAAFRFNGTWLLTATSGQQDISEIEPRLGMLDGVLDQIPDFVWQDRKGAR